MLKFFITLMALRRSLLWIDEASLFETFGSLKIRNLGVYLKFLFLISTTTNLLHLYYINIASDETLEKKNIIITKPDEGNGVVILDWKIYDNAIQEIISDTSKFEKLSEGPTLKREASLQRFYVSWNIKTFVMKMNMINCILLVLLLVESMVLLLISMVLLKCTNFLLVIHFLNFIQLFHL